MTATMMTTAAGIRLFGFLPAGCFGTMTQARQDTFVQRIRDEVIGWLRTRVSRKGEDLCALSLILSLSRERRRKQCLHHTILHGKGVFGEKRPTGGCWVFILLFFLAWSWVMVCVRCMNTEASHWQADIVNHRTEQGSWSWYSRRRMKFVLVDCEDGWRMHNEQALHREISCLVKFSH